MTRTLPDRLVRREGRLLFVLLDAAESNGMLSAAPQAGQWQHAKERVLQSGDFERDAALFYEIMGELDGSGRIAGSWIEQRWQAIKSRVAGAN